MGFSDTINSDPTENSWHQRTVDLTAYAGKTVNHFYIVADAGTPVGNWNIFYGDISIVHADGTVTTIYDRATGESFSYFTGGGETGTNAVVERSNQTGDSVTPAGTTTYFLADQIHSTRMTLAYGGWPMTQDTYYPFGVEPTPSASPDQYKFSGKERDPASGLDNFGARYYSAVMGRFMTPDWSAKPEPVPYAKLDNPQSLNLYTYVLNNPLTGIDPDGHKFCGSALGSLTTRSGLHRDATVTCADHPPGAPSVKGWWSSFTGSLAAGVARISPSAARALWETANPGQKVPFDSVRGRFFDMAHIKALADGGTNAAENLKPQEHGAHMAEHSANGDFTRWAAQARDTVVSGAKSAQQEINEDSRESVDALSNDIRNGVTELMENPEEAIKDVLTTVVEGAEEGELPPF